jgi:hypothetical protein
VSRRGDKGQIAGIEGVAFGVLVLILGILVVANAWAVVDAKLAASAAAREAARAYAESDGVSPDSDAIDAALATVASHGRNPERTSIDLGSARWERCARVTVTVRYDGTLAAIPILHHLRGFTVTAEHSEVVDPYRSGIPGEASC